jgi:hypothetical protein
MNRIQAVGQRLLRGFLVFLGLLPNNLYTGSFSTTRPAKQDLAPGEIVIVQGGGKNKWACFRCPCGSGEIVSLYLGKERRPRWDIVTDFLGRATVKPSIRQTDGCLCHFWLKQGRIEWCKDSSTQVGELGREVI